MSLHDAYARTTPFEIAFPDEGALERLTTEVLEEASARGLDPSHLGAFVTLGAVAEFVHALRPEQDPSGAALHPYGALVFHALHFQRAGRPVYLLETAVARELVEDVPGGEPRVPTTAGYLQLPQHLFWMDGWGDGAPESVDGLFWSASESDVLHVLPVAGVLPERPGFRALPLPEAPMDDAPGWLEAQMRQGGDDFASSLPGHDLDRLYAVETAGEVLKLLGRFFAYLDAGAGAAEPRGGAAAGSRQGGEAEGRAPTSGARSDESREPSGGRPGRGPRPSRLPFTRVRKVA